MMKIVDTERASAEKIMQLDQELLNMMHPDDPPILHFYEWEEPSATFGLFVELNKFINSAGQAKIAFAKRPTGGGLIFHLWDFAFSILVGSNHPDYPKNDILARYRMINSKLVDLLNPFIKRDPTLLQAEQEASSMVKRFCMASPTKFDVMVGGKKLVGSAIRAKKNGFLYQGTISLYKPDYDLLELILNESIRDEVICKIKESSYYLGEMIDPGELKGVLSKLRLYN